MNQSSAFRIHCGKWYEKYRPDSNQLMKFTIVKFIFQKTHIRNMFIDNSSTMNLQLAELFS